MYIYIYIYIYVSYHTYAYISIAYPSPLRPLPAAPRTPPRALETLIIMMMLSYRCRPGASEGLICIYIYIYIYMYKG